MKSRTAVTLLGDMGMPKGNGFPKPTDYPKILKPEFLELYIEFLKTKYAKDLYAISKDKDIGRLYVIHGFISYTMNYTSYLFRKEYNLNKLSTYFLLESIKDERKPMIEKIRHYGILKEFQVADTRVSLKPKGFDDHINVLTNFTSHVDFIFTLKHNRNIARDDEGKMRSMPTSLIPALHRLKGYMFKRDLPPELLPKTSYKRDRFPLTEDVIRKQTRTFAQVDKNVYAHLSGKSSFILRFKLESVKDAALFLGTQQKSLITRVEKSASTLF